MSLEDYKISDIGDIKFYGKRLIKKNIPEFIKVTEHEFNTFVKNRPLIYIRDRSADFPDTIDYFDKYDNCVAYQSAWIDKVFYINPKLYDIGKERQCKIVDEYSNDNELLFTLDNVTTISVQAERVQIERSE